MAVNFNISVFIVSSCTSVTFRNIILYESILCPARVLSCVESVFLIACVCLHRKKMCCSVSNFGTLRVPDTKYMDPFIIFLHFLAPSGALVFIMV